MWEKNFNSPPLWLLAFNKLLTLFWFIPSWTCSLPPNSDCWSSIPQTASTRWCYAVKTAPPPTPGSLPSTPTLLPCCHRSWLTSMPTWGPLPRPPHTPIWNISAGWLNRYLKLCAAERLHCILHTVGGNVPSGHFMTSLPNSGTFPLKWQLLEEADVSFLLLALTFEKWNMPLNEPFASLV